jgi:membrane protease subunit HflK
MPVPENKKLGLKWSLNDPRWGRDPQDENGPNRNQDGRKPNEGPPDLDQLWREFNQRLNRLFGNRGGRGEGGGGFNPDMRGAGLGIALAAVIALFLWLVSGFFIVQEGQTGVVLTFGKYTRLAPAGFNWRWPYPIQTDQIVNVSEVRTVEIGYRSSLRNKQPQEALMLTDDENIVDIQFAVQYTLKSAPDWVFSNRDPEARGVKRLRWTWPS